MFLYRFNKFTQSNSYMMKVMSYWYLTYWCFCLLPLLDWNEGGPSLLAWTMTYKCSLTCGQGQHHSNIYRPTQPLLCITLETEPLVFASLTSDRGQIVVRLCQHWIYQSYANSFWSPGRPAIVSDHMSEGEFTFQGHGALEFNCEGWDIPDYTVL